MTSDIWKTDDARKVLRELDNIAERISAAEGLRFQSAPLLADRVRFIGLVADFINVVMEKYELDASFRERVQRTLNEKLLVAEADPETIWALYEKSIQLLDRLRVLLESRKR